MNKILLALLLCAGPAYADVATVPGKASALSADFGFVSVSSPSAVAVKAATEQDLFWHYEDTDTISGFVAASSSIITIPVTAVYLITAQVSVETAGTETVIWVYRGATKFITSDCDPTTASAESTCTATKIGLLLAGDTIKASVYAQAATRLNTRRDLSWLQIKKL